MFLKAEQDEQMQNNEIQLPMGNNRFRQVNKQQLKQIILQTQNQQQKGYYTFSEWGKLHQSIFGLIASNLPQTALNLWRVLKLINFGDDYIPTGLIYDTLVSLMMMTTQLKSQTQKNKMNQHIEVILRTIFFKFIEFNGKYLSDKQKQQLGFFRVIKGVTEGYRKIITSHLKNNLQQGQNIGKGTLHPGMSRNQQLYKMYDVFVYKKNLQKLKKIEEQFKQCTFQPDLSYTSRSNFQSQSRYLQAKKVKNPQLATSHLIHNPNYIITEQEDQQQRLFKANPIPYYPEVNTNGLNQHLQRMQKSRQIKRINTIRHYPSLGSTINKSRSRKKKKDVEQLQNFIYDKSISREENIQSENVVKAIQMMVGFKHPQVEQIVKGYFINWQMKVKQNRSVSIKDQYIYE